MSFVWKPVKEVVSWVGDATSDAIDWTVDEILKPVADAVGGVLEGMADDPITTIVTIAAVATGNAWAIPLIQGASTAAHGGDVKDIAISMAASYVGSKAGSYVGTYVGAEVGAAAGSQAAGQIAAQAAAGATRATVTAAATGQDIKKAAFSGAVSGAVSGAISEAGSAIAEGVESDIDYSVDATSEDFLNYESVDKSVGVELKDLVSGWETLPEIAQDMIRSGAAATISQLTTTGEVNTDAVAGVMANAAVTSSAVARTLKENTGTTDKQAAVFTHVVGNVVTAAYMGADPYKAYQSTLNSIGQKELQTVLDDVTKGGLDRVVDNLTGALTTFETAQKTANEAAGLVDASAERANAKINEAGVLEKELRDLGGKVQSTAAAAREYDARYRELLADYTIYEGQRKRDYEVYTTERDRWTSGYNYGSEAARDNARQRIKDYGSSTNDFLKKANAAVEESNRVLSLREDKKAELRAYESAYTTKESDYNFLRVEAERLHDDHQTFLAQYNNTLNTVNETKKDLFTNEKYLDEAIQPTEKIATEAVVKVIRPDFNAAQYRTLHNLEGDVDPYRHWLQTGRVNSTNTKEYDKEVTSLIRNALPYDLFIKAEDVK